MTAVVQSAPAPICEPRACMVGDGFSRRKHVTITFDVPGLGDHAIHISPAHAATLRNQLNALDLPRASQ